VQLAREGHESCRDSAEALALGRVYERAELLDRAEACYRRAAAADSLEVKGEALYRLGLRLRRDRRFVEAAAAWRDVLAMTEPRHVRRRRGLGELREFAVEALAIHQEHRERDLTSARELALFALQDLDDGAGTDGMRHRLARLDRKLAKKKDAQLFSS
jgi:tetratricopeptide (TPR) repeat protein